MNATIGSIFSGIGGIELGFEREGFWTKWFIEKDPFCRTVLKKHFPKAAIYGDVAGIDFSRLPKVDVLTGGFPCQDISVAGKRKGLKEGERSSLWRYYAEAIGKIRPRFAVIENVPNLVNLGLDQVLADLAEVRYNAEWLCISASSVGAPHKRERIFVIAYPERNVDKAQIASELHEEARMETEDRPQHLPSGQPARAAGGEGADRPQEYGDVARTFITDDFSERVQRFREEQIQRFEGFQRFQGIRDIQDVFRRRDIPEPLIRGGNDGIPNRVDRTHAIGNAVVPQVAQIIARRIKEIL